MKVRWLFVLSSVVVWCAAGPVCQASAQDKDVTVEGKVQLGIHKFKLDPAKFYQFEVKGKDFNPNVFFMDGGYMRNMADFFKERDTFRGLFSPSKNQEYALVVAPNVFGGGTVPEGPLTYTVTMKTMSFEEKPALEKEDKVSKDDPRYTDQFRKTPFKGYTLKLQKGKTYIIDMVRTNPGKEQLDPYLLLENPGKMVVAQDDDSGGSLNARIMYRANEDGEYRIIATGLSDFSSNGAYKLTVRTVREQ